MKWDAECPNLRYIDILLTKVPHDYGWPVALSIYGL